MLFGLKMVLNGASVGRTWQNDHHPPRHSHSRLPQSTAHIKICSRQELWRQTKGGQMMKIKIKVCQGYREMDFGFNCLQDAEAFISTCVHQGYEVKISLADGAVEE
jgi:hypothetical protein